MDGLLAVRYCVHNSRVNCTGPVWPSADRCDRASDDSAICGGNPRPLRSGRVFLRRQPLAGNGDDGFGTCGVDGRAVRGRVAGDWPAAEVGVAGVSVAGSGGPRGARLCGVRRARRVAGLRHAGLPASATARSRRC